MSTRRSLPLAILGLALSACLADPSVPVSLRAIELRLATPSYVYGDGQELALVAVVVDSRGVARPEVPVSISPDSSSRATIIVEGVQEASFALEGTGPITFTACIMDAPELCDALTLVVDDGRPVLALDAPSPGDEIDAPEGVYVHGTALDASPTLEVFVNGERVELAEDGSFETTLPPRFGVRHIDVVATDALTETARFELDVLYAGAFTPAKDDDGAPVVRVEDAVGIWLGQDFFDDGLAIDPGASPMIARDIADVIALVVSNASLTTLIPNPVFDSSILTLDIPNATLGAPQVELSVLDGGVDIFIRVSALALTTAGSFTLDSETFPLNGTITGSVVAHLRLGIAKASATSDAVVSLSSFSVAIESVQGSFANADVNAIFAAGQSLLSGTVEGYLRDALEEVLVGSLPAVLETVLDGIDRALDGVSLELGQAPLTALTLTLNGRMSRVETRYRQHLLAPLSITISSDAEDQHPGSRGVAQLSATPTPTDFFDASTAQLGLRLGFVNGVLHVLWSSGLLDLDVKPLVPSFAASLVNEAQLVPKLPPILRPPREDESSDLVLSIGQLELELLSRGEVRRFGIFLEAGVDITLVDNALVLSVSETPSIYVWENAPPESTGILTVSLVGSLLTSLWPDLRTALVSGLEIVLPIPPLPLEGIAPALDGFSLRLSETSDRLYPRGELLLLDVAMMGRVP